MPLPTHGRAPGLLFTRKTPAHVQLRVAGRAEEFTILAKVLASADLFRRTLAQFTQAKHVEWYFTPVLIEGPVVTGF